MAKEESFMLVSLNEEKAKKLAQVISNETCTKILKHFSSGKDGTETDIAKELGLPLSTVHYNLKQLVDAKLVVADEYHYSEKGREVLHYRLANKYIIIAPEEEKEGFLKKLKGLLPAAIVVAGVAVAMKLTNLFAFGKMAASSEMSRFVATQSLPDAMPIAYDAGADAVGGASPVMAKAAPAAMQYAEIAVENASQNASDLAAFGQMAAENVTENVTNVVQNFNPPVEQFHQAFNWAQLVSNEAILFFLGGAALVFLILAAGMYVRKK